MTRYAYGGDGQELIAMWETGQGALFTSVATSIGADPVDVVMLTHALTRLSGQLWRCYTHPASAAPSTDPNTEGWQREQARAAFSAVLPALAAPNLPENGTLVVSYDPVEESAHHVGRALALIDDAALAQAVTREVRTEIGAVESAELGDLTGRAAQAVVLSRQDVSPVQVAAAHELLGQNPLGALELFTSLDPASAAVAAALWLHAAAKATAEVSGIDPVDIVAEADAVEPLPYRTPTLVLELLENELTPTEIVTQLIRHAMDIAEGQTHDPDGIIELLQHELEPPDYPTEVGGDPEPPPWRLTPLDPRRPALDLLEDLLYGIQGCWLIYGTYADRAGTQNDEPDDDKADADRLRRRGDFVATTAEIATADRHRIGL